MILANDFLVHNSFREKYSSKLKLIFCSFRSIFFFFLDKFLALIFNSNFFNSYVYIT